MSNMVEVTDRVLSVFSMSVISTHLVNDIVFILHADVVDDSLVTVHNHPFMPFANTNLLDSHP